jgi:hypothetical protein
MTVPAPHFDLVREMKDAYNHRLRLVESAKQRGIKPTARLFATPRREWLPVCSSGMCPVRTTKVATAR